MCILVVLTFGKCGCVESPFQNPYQPCQSFREARALEEDGVDMRDQRIYSFDVACYESTREVSIGLQGTCTWCWDNKISYVKDYIQDRRGMQPLLVHRQLEETAWERVAQTFTEFRSLALSYARVRLIQKGFPPDRETAYPEWEERSAEDVKKENEKVDSAQQALNAAWEAAISQSHIDRIDFCEAIEKHFQEQRRPLEMAVQQIADISGIDFIVSKVCSMTNAKLES
jgi:hypothetical protein